MALLHMPFTGMLQLVKYNGLAFGAIREHPGQFFQDQVLVCCIPNLQFLAFCSHTAWLSFCIVPALGEYYVLFV
jgi:hypothetical protein